MLITCQVLYQAFCMYYGFHFITILWMKKLRIVGDPK